MNRGTTFPLTIMALLPLAVALSVGEAAAQQTPQKVSYKVSAQNSKFTQQQFLDVGDVPGHQVRSFEIHRTYPERQGAVTLSSTLLARPQSR